MKRRNHTPEQIIRKLVEPDKLLAQGSSFEEAQGSSIEEVAGVGIDRDELKRRAAGPCASGDGDRGSTIGSSRATR